MTREEFGTLVKGMKAVYPSATFIPDKDAFDVWYALLQDLDYTRASMAAQRHMMTEKFPPTISDIRSGAVEVSAPTEMTEMEAWSRVYKAICDLRYDEPEKEFNRLPELCRIAVGTPANLREMATMPTDTVLSVEQSHFLRNYRNAKERKKSEDMLSIDLQSRIEDARRIMGRETKEIEGDA